MINKNLGLCGAHCTGKTTLAQELSELTGMPFARTSTSKVMQELGFTPDAAMTFDERLTVQELILDAAEELWGSFKDTFISDRTPMDMIAYTLAAIQGETLFDQHQLTDYIYRCREITNKYFSHIILLQPGIPLIGREGKAALNEGYIVHLNTILMGLTVSDHLEGEVLWIPLHETSLGQSPPFLRVDE